MKLFSIFVFLFTSFTYLQSQCGITGMQSQILKDSSFSLQNTGSTSIVNGNYPSKIGVEEDGSISNSKLLSPGENGSIISSSTTMVQKYEVEINNPSIGCIETIDVEVVTVLPVEWHQPIGATIFHNKTRITFIISHQTNNSHFEIEHSQNDTEFQSIGRIEGQGNSSDEIKYEFIHGNPAEGLNYYRIKQVDFDGQYSYRNVASVLYKSETISVYPNPLIDRLTVNSPINCSVSIYDQAGKKVKS